MSEYLPVIIVAVIIAVALLWWLTARGSVSESSSPSKVIDAPPVAPASTAEKTAKAEKFAVAPLMADPKPASKSAMPRPQAPLKTAATKSAPVKKAAPKAVATKPAPKPVAAKASAPKTTLKPHAAVKTAAAPKAAPTPIVPDNLELLKGVGPKLNSLLKSLGVTSFEQVANWGAADVTEIDSKLGTFAGRISRDNWIDQAKLLSSGDIAGFEKKYGALGSDAQKG